MTYIVIPVPLDFPIDGSPAGLLACQCKIHFARGWKCLRARLNGVQGHISPGAIHALDFIPFLPLLESVGFCPFELSTWHPIDLLSIFAPIWRTSLVPIFPESSEQIYPLAWLRLHVMAIGIRCSWPRRHDGRLDQQSPCWISVPPQSHVSGELLVRTHLCSALRHML